MHFGPLCMQLRVPVRFFSLWEGQKWGFFPKDRTYRAFLHNKLFFLIAPRDLHYYWASAQPSAALRSLAQLTTPFFRMVPEGLNAFWTFVHAAESASSLF